MNRNPVLQARPSNVAVEDARPDDDLEMHVQSHATTRPGKPGSTPPVILDRDTPCRSCGYNLRGLTDDGSCPECANPIRASPVPDLLADADPQWLHDLFVGVLLLTVYPVARPFISTLVAAGAENRWMESFTLAMLVAGAWLLSEPEPGCARRPSASRTNAIVKGAALMAGLVGLVRIASGTVSGWPANASAATYQAMVFLVYLGALHRARHLAERAPDRALVRWTRRAMLILPVFWILSLTRFLLPDAAVFRCAPAPPGNSAWRAVVFPIAIVGAMGTQWSAFLGLFLGGWLSDVLDRAVRSARTQPNRR